MLTFMDYIVYAFGTSTDWNYDNSYSFLTATSDNLLSFYTPSSLSFHVSSLSTPNFATSYTLSTVGQIDGSLSYLYSSVPLNGIPSGTQKIPLRSLVRGYRDVKLPPAASEIATNISFGLDGRKPTLLHATLALPPPSTLTALYARRIDPQTLLSISLNSKSISSQSTGSGPPPASVLAHLQYDAGRFSVEGLGSTDNALLGVRGLWNFGLGPPKKKRIIKAQDTSNEVPEDLLESSNSTSPESSTMDAIDILQTAAESKPSLLSAGAEFYYSPFSHVIGLSTGLRFTTLASHIPAAGSCHVSPSKPLAGTSAALSNALLTPANVAHSSFPYTMTLTLTPLTGSLASTYSVKPTPNLALSSRFDFNVYSWESQYVLGAEIWRRRRKKGGDEEDSLAWARERAKDWLTDAERALKAVRAEREDENVINLRVDDGWNFKALWTGRIKALLVSVGVGVAPVRREFIRQLGPTGEFRAVQQMWSGTVGVEIAYST